MAITVALEKIQNVFNHLHKPKYGGIYDETIQQIEQFIPESRNFNIVENRCVKTTMVQSNRFTISELLVMTPFTSATVIMSEEQWIVFSKAWKIYWDFA